MQTQRKPNSLPPALRGAVAENTRPKPICHFVQCWIWCKSLRASHLVELSRGSSSFCMVWAVGSLIRKSIWPISTARSTERERGGGESVGLSPSGQTVSLLAAQIRSKARHSAGVVDSEPLVCCIYFSGHLEFFHGENEIVNIQTQ